MNHVTHKISKFCYIKKYRYRLHFDTQFLVILTFLESLKIVLVKMVTILMVSAKMVTPGLLKGCVHYIFASLFLKSKREHLSN